MFDLSIQLLVLLLLSNFPIAEGTSASKLPIVDLGYELHQASSFIVSAFNCNPISLFPNYIQSEAGLYNFSNIRYAEPPVGELRFRASVPPRNRSKIIDQGKIGRVCPQASPGWLTFASGLANSSSSPPDPRLSEDCLFLDIIVPQKVFEQAAPHRLPLAPVLVWIHGGGYTFGEKTGGGQYNPAGLIKTRQSSNSTGLVYVAINYRVSLHLSSILWCRWHALFSLVHLDGFRAPICKLMVLPMPASTISNLLYAGSKSISSILAVTLIEWPSSESHQVEVVLYIS